MSTYRLEKQKEVPQIGDISIPISPIFPNHFSKYFIPSVEDLFQVGDCILKVEDFGSKSCLISWRVCFDDNYGIRWQMDFTDEQNFILLPFDVVILNPMQEGEQFDLFSWLKANSPLLVWTTKAKQIWGINI